MSDHYYSANPGAARRPQTIHFTVRGVTGKLTTDSGVFSKSGVDFGTRLLVETVDLPGHAHCVDLGCGYGIVTYILARVYPDSSWELVDVNERAVELAGTNLRALANPHVLHCADGLSTLERNPDVILLNPPIRAGKTVIYRLFEESRAALGPRGALWIVINKKHGAASAQQFLSDLFESVDVVHKKSGYYVLRCSG